jgi:hypothetical protein
MEPITKDQIAASVADMVYKDIALLRQDILGNRDQMLLLDSKLNNILVNKASLVTIIGKFLQLL